MYIMFQSAITFLHTSIVHLEHSASAYYVEKKTLQFTMGITTLIQEIISLLIRFALAFRF